MKLLEIQESKFNYLAKKYIFIGDNGYTVSSVYIDRMDKDIVCLSCMYGCPVGCGFCKSGENYYGKISSADMNFMCDYIAKDNNFTEEKRKVFSFMGNGEPLLNHSQVANTINYIGNTYKNYKVSVSLSGPDIGLFPQFIKNIKVQLPKFQFSLHSPFNQERESLIPYTSNLELIWDVFNDYLNAHSDEKIELNYVLLNGINDSDWHSTMLAGIINLLNDISNNKYLLKINEYHLVNPKYFESVNKDNFIKKLKEFNIIPEVYSTDGVEIGAACGQLNSQQIYNLTK